MYPLISIIGVKGIGEVRKGEKLGFLINDALNKQGIKMMNNDIIVVTSKVVSKAENMLISLNTVTPSKFATNISKMLKKDPRFVEAILNESKRIVRISNAVIITQTKHGYICANSGIDQSNIKKDHIALLPVNPDRSATQISAQIKIKTGQNVAVIISDTFGRPWRHGQVQFAIGIAGILPTIDYRGKNDRSGNELKVTEIAIVDEIASAAELVLGKLNDCPAALIRGFKYNFEAGFAKSLVRSSREDLFK